MKSADQPHETLGAVAVVLLLAIAIAAWLFHAADVCRGYAHDRAQPARAHHSAPFQ